MPTDTHNDKLEPCPFCQVAMRVLPLLDRSGFVGFHPDNDCVLSGCNVAPNKIEKWNTRTQSERSSMEGEIAGIADRLLRQADCLDRYAEQSGFPEKPVPSVFHLQSSHFRDLAKELAALNRSAKPSRTPIGSDLVERVTEAVSATIKQYAAAFYLDCAGCGDGLIEKAADKLAEFVTEAAIEAVSGQ